MNSNNIVHVGDNNMTSVMGTKPFTICQFHTVWTLLPKYWSKRASLINQCFFIVLWQYLVYEVFLARNSRLRSIWLYMSEYKWNKSRSNNNVMLIYLYMRKNDDDCEMISLVSSFMHIMNVMGMSNKWIHINVIFVYGIVLILDHRMICLVSYNGNKLISSQSLQRNL